MWWGAHSLSQADLGCAEGGVGSVLPQASSCWGVSGELLRHTRMEISPETPAREPGLDLGDWERLAVSERTWTPLGGRGQWQALTPEAWTNPTALLLAGGCRPGNIVSLEVGPSALLGFACRCGPPCPTLQEAQGRPLPSAWPDLLGGP